MLHLILSLSGSGFHPAAWQMSGPPLDPTATPLYPLVDAAERASLDAILLGVPICTADGRPRPEANTMQLDPLPLAGALIGRTRRIGIAATWTVDFAEPFNVARVLATLDHLSYGRAAWFARMFATEQLAPLIGRKLGIGSPGEYCDRAAEFIAVVRQLWDSWEDEAFVVDKASGRFGDPERVHPINHRGRYFTIRGPLNLPRPPQGNPVIIEADTGGTDVGQLVAATADVMLINSSSPSIAGERRRELRSSAGASKSCRILCNLLLVLGSTAEQAWRRAHTLDSILPANWTGARFVGTPTELIDWMAAWSSEEACDGFNLLPAVLPDDASYLLNVAIPLAQKRGLFRREYTGTTLRDHLQVARPRSQFADPSRAPS